MNDVFAVLFAVWFSFFAGMMLVLLFGRGLFGLFLKAFFTGRIMIRIHLKNGGATYRLGIPVDGGSMVAFSLYSKKDKRFVSLDPYAIVRAVRVRWMDVDENDTAPFRYDKVVPFEREVDVPIYDEDQGEEKLKAVKEGKPLTEKVKVVAYKVFESWNDNAIVRQVYHWALMRPRRKLPGLGMDLKTLLIVLAVILGIIFFVLQLTSQGGTPPPPGNVIG